MNKVQLHTRWWNFFLTIYFFSFALSNTKPKKTVHSHRCTTLNICEWTWNINEWAEFSAVWPITSNSKAKQVGFLLQSPCYTCCLEGMNSHTHTRTHAHTHTHTQLYSTICCRLASRPATDSELWNRNKSLWEKEAEEPWRKHFCWRAWNNPWRAPVTGSRIKACK